MTKPPSNVQDGLLVALRHMATSPDLTEAEVSRLNQFAMHLIAEFSVLKSEDEEVRLGSFVR